jgi:hypothetical protein
LPHHRSFGFDLFNPIPILLYMAARNAKAFREKIFNTVGPRKRD